MRRHSSSGGAARRSRFRICAARRRWRKHIPALLDAGVNVEAGGHGHATFRRQDLIVLSPGVAPNTPEMDEARTFHIPIIGEVELAARFLKTKILCHHRFEREDHDHDAGRRDPEGGRTHDAGGRQHRAAGDRAGGMPENQPDSWSVLELSSFQLESVDTFHPKIAVMLNLTPDHLDRHGKLRELCRGEGADVRAARLRKTSWC